MPRNRLLAHAQDATDLPIALATGNPQDTVALAVGELRGVGFAAVAAARPQPARRLEGEPSGELRERQCCLRDGPAGLDRKRAGTSRLARNVCRNSEAIADSLRAAELKDSLIARRERDHLGHLRPAEPHAGDVARSVDRVAHAERLGIVIIGPLRRIVVQPDRAVADDGNIDVMAQGKVLESKLQRDRQKNPCQFVSIAGSLNDPGELQRNLVQPHRLSLRRRAASQAAGAPAAALSRTSGPVGGFSDSLPANETAELQQHSARTHEIKVGSSRRADGPRADWKASSRPLGAPPR